ncbi:hypothetical protein GPECTOR_71g554 [Gonium pectorale]|uniref:Uncharacterized protein n=1 Tax=Gonium pectorale TaxID=33097 RepID=A0A150G302_GONPE|nr:hypothetical protein GPECTOR_71g554 [Gonium pectorale]|eukprot:KXZ44193.1 hypothetical protein GPECTOR_71g554 [Gonium pectorale]
MGCGASRDSGDWVKVKTTGGATIVVHKDTLKPKASAAAVAKAKEERAAQAALAAQAAQAAQAAAAVECVPVPPPPPPPGGADAPSPSPAPAPPPAVTRLGVTLRGLRRIRQRLREFFGEERYSKVSTSEVNAEWVQVVTRDRRVRLAEAPELMDPADVGTPLYFISGMGACST